MNYELYDHMDSTIAMISSQIPGLDVSEAVITSVDSLGMYVKVTHTPRASDQPQQFKLCLHFPRKAEDRKDVKNIIVGITRSAAVASKEERLSFLTVSMLKTRNIV